MGYILYIVIALLVIMVLVLVHEFGHYIAARLAGVKATEFFIGFGPRIWSFRKGDTEYGIKWILVGGYVKILGMNPDEEVSPEDRPHSYNGVSRWRRFWIIFAGSLSHIILALLIMLIAIWLIGYPFATSTIGAVSQTMPDSEQDTPAYRAGLQEGDAILAMNGEEVGDWNDVRSFIADHPGEEVTLLISRDGVEQEFQVQLAERDGGGYLGIGPKEGYEGYSFFGAAEKTFWWFGQASYGVAYGFYRVFNLSTLKQLVGISEPTIERPVTVVGASRVAGQFFRYGIFYFLSFIAVILLFLAYINLLPLPPLDGGYLLVLLVEKITGKDIDLRKLYPIAVAVLLFFGALFLLTLRLDLTNPINLP